MGGVPCLRFTPTRNTPFHVLLVQCAPTDNPHLESDHLERILEASELGFPVQSPTVNPQPQRRSLCTATTVRKVLLGASGCHFAVGVQLGARNHDPFGTRTSSDMGKSNRLTGAAVEFELRVTQDTSN